MYWPADTPELTQLSKIIDNLLYYTYVTEKLTVDHCLWSYTWPGYSCSTATIRKIAVVRMRTLPKFVFGLCVSLFSSLCDPFLQIVDKLLWLYSGKNRHKPDI